MVEPRLAPRLSAAARPKNRFRHLTRHGGSWRFQLRVPADLDPERKFGAVRCNLGALPIRVAHRKARGLAAAAEVVFARARNGVRSEMPDRMIAEFCRDPLGFFAASGLMLTFGELFPDLEPPLDVQADIKLVRDFAMIDRELKRAEPSPYVVENHDSLRKEAASRAANLRANFFATQLAATGATAAGAADVGASGAQVSDRLLSILETQAALISRLLDGSIPANSLGIPPIQQAVVVEVDETPVAKSIPSFGQAAEKYISNRIEANGDVESADIKSIRSRAAMFIELVGDKRVDLYEHSDFQKFVNQLLYWPPEPGKYDELKGKTITEIIALNKDQEHRFGILSKNTLTGHYLVETKTILNQAVFDAGIDNPIPKFKLTISNMFKEPKKRETPKMSGMTEAFRIGIESGKIDQAMLNVLGMTTGRRLSPLVCLRGSHLTRVGDLVIAKIPQHIVDPIDGRVTRVQIKTSDSLTGFVLNKILDGFCDFAMDLGDQYVFPARHNCEDPGDAAQKMVNGILTKANTGGSFHGFRGWCITRMRAAGVSTYATRVQSGHAARDEHENYGELPFSEEDAAKIRNLEMPPEVNFDLFKNLDFARLWRNSST